MANESVQAFHSLPFPVYPSQRSMLEQYRANAVAREVQLVARRKQQFECLRRCILEEVERKKLKGQKDIIPANTPQTTSISTRANVSANIQQTTSIPIRVNIPGNIPKTTRVNKSVSQSTTFIPTRVYVPAYTPQATRGNNTNMSVSTSQISIPTRVINTSMPVSTSQISIPTRVINTSIPVNSNKSPGSILSAVVKGYLTRKLLQCDKVQLITATIKDALDLLDILQCPTTRQDKELKQRMEAQLSVARMNLHEIFFQWSPVEQISYIRHSRTLKQQKKQPKKVTSKNHPVARTRSRAVGVSQSNAGKHSVGGKLSAATIKSMQRRQKANHSS